MGVTGKQKCLGFASREGSSLFFEIDPSRSGRRGTLGDQRRITVYSRQRLYEDEHTPGPVWGLDGARRIYLDARAWAALTPRVLENVVWAVRRERASSKVYYQADGPRVFVRAIRAMLNGDFDDPASRTAWELQNPVEGRDL